MARDYGNLVKFARANKPEDWDLEKLWVEPLLFYANGARSIIRNRKHQSIGAFDLQFRPVRGLAQRNDLEGYITPV